MQPGPAPIPTALKTLMGNPGNRPLNGAEPKVTAAKVSAPRSLTDPAARKMYLECAKFLQANGMLGTIDTRALAVACDQYAVGVTLWERAKADGHLVADRFGALKINPAHTLAMQTLDAALKSLRQFGIGSPGERARLKAVEAPKAKTKSKWAGLVSA